jgi:hypothetical protein
MYLCVHSPSRCQELRSHSISRNTLYSFDPLVHHVYAAHLSVCGLLECCPFALCPLARPMVASKTYFHLLQHCFSARPGTSAATAPKFLLLCICTASFSSMPSFSDMYPYVHSPNPRHLSICYNTVLSFDPEPTRQLFPNSGHHAFVPHSSA